MADSSFDVVSKIDRMELDNAINQAIREIDTRFDFKNTGAKIETAGEKIKKYRISFGNIHISILTPDSTATSLDR